jgi:two-component system sensor histidine kinase HydH
MNRGESPSVRAVGIVCGGIIFANGTHYQSGVHRPLEHIQALLDRTASYPVVIEELPPGILKSNCREAEIALVFALPCREQTAWLLLGEKHSGEPFLSEEIALLESVCRQLAVSIDNLSLLQTKIVPEREVQHREKLAAIGQLAATVAHEIRNPITGAKCLLEQVGDALPAASDDGEYIQLALEDLDRVELSVGQLLTFARKEDYQFLPHNVTDLLHTTVQSFAVQAKEKEVAVSCPARTPLAAEAVEVMIDGEKIRRTLLNLLTNALDAVGFGGTIHISIETTGPEVEIRVSDNGQGLNQADQEHILSPSLPAKKKAPA